MKYNINFTKLYASIEHLLTLAARVGDATSGAYFVPACPTLKTCVTGYRPGDTVQSVQPMVTQTQYDVHYNALLFLSIFNADFYHAPAFLQKFGVSVVKKYKFWLKSFSQPEKVAGVYQRNSDCLRKLNQLACSFIVAAVKNNQLVQFLATQDVFFALGQPAVPVYTNRYMPNVFTNSLLLPEFFSDYKSVLVYHFLTLPNIKRRNGLWLHHYVDRVQHNEPAMYKRAVRDQHILCVAHIMKLPFQVKPLYPHAQNIDMFMAGVLLQKLLVFFTEGDVLNHLSQLCACAQHALPSQKHRQLVASLALIAHHSLALTERLPLQLCLRINTLSDTVLHHARRKKKSLALLMRMQYTKNQYFYRMSRLFNFYVNCANDALVLSTNQGGNGISTNLRV